MKKKVLIIDDDPDIQLLLKTILEREGWETVTAGDGPSGLALLEEADPDVILLDFNMPGMDGREVLERIKERRCHVPVIMVTAVTRQELPLEFLEIGAFDFLSKPLKRSDIIFSATKAYYHKILWDRLAEYEEKDYGFSELEKNIKEMAEGNSHKEMGKFLLLAKQKSFALEAFFSQYLVRRPGLLENVAALNRFLNGLDPESAVEGQRAGDVLKSYLEDLDNSLEETISLLNELKMREERFKKEDGEENQRMDEV